MDVQSSSWNPVLYFDNSASPFRVTFCLCVRNQSSCETIHMKMCSSGSLPCKSNSFQEGTRKWPIKILDNLVKGCDTVIPIMSIVACEIMASLTWKHEPAVPLPSKFYNSNVWKLVLRRLALAICLYTEDKYNPISWFLYIFSYSHLDKNPMFTFTTSRVRWRHIHEGVYHTAMYQWGCSLRKWERNDIETEIKGSST